MYEVAESLVMWIFLERKREDMKIETLISVRLDCIGSTRLGFLAVSFENTRTAAELNTTEVDVPWGNV